MGLRAAVACGRTGDSAGAGTNVRQVRLTPRADTPPLHCILRSCSLLRGSQGSDRTRIRHIAALRSGFYADLSNTLWADR